MSLVAGVIFDESVLFSNADDSSFQLRPGAPLLLSKFHLSNIRMAISYGLDLSADKESGLKRMAVEYSCEFFLFDTSMDGAVNEICRSWSDVGGSILYVVSDNKDAFHKLSCHWLIIVIGIEGASACDNLSILNISKIEELPLTICRLNKKVNDFSDPDLAQRLSKAKLYFPSIVKPQVACGVADAHSMAIVFGVEDFKHLSVPLPAIVQEYVNHSSTLFKFYVLGENVFYAVKKSTPNSINLMKSYERNGFRPIMFGSLKSLPIDIESGHSGDATSFKVDDLDLGLVKDAANWLAGKLDLTIFGFDVVIQEGTGDHVIVDVNYLPSFKEVPKDIAIPAFWDAIKSKFELKKTNRAAKTLTP